MAAMQQTAARMAVALFLGAMCGQLSIAAEAQRPNLSGFWMLASGKPFEDPALKAKISPGAVILKDTGAVEFPLMEFGGLKLTPAAEAAAKSWDSKDDMSVANACRIPSIIYAMQGPFPIEVFQGTEMTVIRLEYFDMARVIYTDGRKHQSADGPMTKVGDSIGH